MCARKADPARNPSSGTERVNLRNAQRKVRLNTAELAAFAAEARRACDRIPARRPWPKGEISVVFVSDRTMAALHARFMSVPGPTDVLTFQHGEIVISVETARRQARQYRSSFEREVRLYIVHGFLHLRGYDDQKATGAREMEALQERILRRIS